MGQYAKVSFADWVLERGLQRVAAVRREFRGPVTAVAAVEGALAIAAGARLEVHALTASRLEQTAFHDAAFLVTALRSYGAYLLTGDASHGVAFFHYHVRPQIRGLTTPRRTTPHQHISGCSPKLEGVGPGYRLACTFPLDGGKSVSVSIKVWCSWLRGTRSLSV